jgi:hypothetical protein
VRLRRGASRHNPLIEVYAGEAGGGNNPEGRPLHLITMADLVSRYIDPKLQRAIMDALLRMKAQREKPHPIPFHPEMHGFRSALESALGATVRARARNPSQVSARAGSIMRTALGAREAADKVRVPFVESMPYARRRVTFAGPATSAIPQRASAGTAPRQPPQPLPRAAFANRSAASLRLSALLQHSPRPSLVPARPRAPATLRSATLPNAPLHSTLFPSMRPPPPYGPSAAAGAPPSSITDRPRRKCRCAGGSRWPTNR